MDDGVQVEETLREIVKRITPAVADIAARGENSEIVLRFKNGSLRQAVRMEVTL